MSESPLKQIQIEFKPNFFVHDKKLKLANNSLFIFTPESKLRQAAVWLMEWKYFDQFIIFMIILNTFSLTMQDYSKRLGEEYQNKIGVPHIQHFLDQNDKIFSIIFICEFLVKVIALGFIFEKHTYLRNPWNVIDFIVVASSISSFLPNTSNLSAIRTMRMLRPLRSFNQIKDVKVILQALIKSLPELSEVMIFLLYVFLLFSIFGLEIFRGLLYQRCRITEYPKIDGTWQADNDYLYLCNPEDEHSCPENRFCGNPLKYKMHVNENELKEQEFFYGAMTFDNIFLSYFTVSQVMIAEYWTNLGFLLRDGYQQSIIYTFFMILQFFGAFYIMNLILAIFTTTFSNALNEVKIENLQQLQNTVLKTEESQKQDSIENQETMAVTQEHKDNDSNISEEGHNQQHNQQQYKYQSQIIIKIKTILATILQSSFFIQFINLCILLNTISLAMDQYPINIRREKFLSVMNQILTVLFALELLLQFMAFGVKKSLNNLYQIFDAAVITISSADLIMHYVKTEQNSHSYAIVAIFRILRIFRIVRLVTRACQSLRYLLEAMTKTLQSIAQYMILLALFFTIISLLGMEFYAYRIRLDEQGNLERDIKKYADGVSPRLNFDTFFQAFTTAFVFTTGDNWSDTMYLYFESLRSWSPAIFFFVIKILGRFIIMKIYLAILITTFQQMEQQMLDKSKSVSNRIKKGKSYISKFLLSQGRSVEKSSSVIIQEENSKFGRSLLSRITMLNQQKQDNQEKIINKRKKSDIFNKSVIDNKNNETIVIKTLDKNNQSEIQLQQIKEQNSKEKKGKNLSRQQSIKSKQGKNSSNKNGVSPSDSSDEESDQQIILFQPKILSFLEDNAHSLNLKKKINKYMQLIKGTSLLFFNQNSNIRLFCIKIQQNSTYQNFVLFLIIFSSITLSLEKPMHDQDESITKILLYTNNISTIFFIIEMLIKIITQGFLFNGQYSYLRDLGNVLDFIVVLISSIDFLSVGNRTLAKFKVLRVFRVLKPLRVISRNQGLKLALNSIIKSFNGVTQLLGIIIITFTLFGIIGVNFLKGTFYSCDKSSFENYYQSLVDLPQIITKTDCLDYGGEWVNGILNFDNIINAFSLLFTVSLFDSWSQFMFQSIDAVGIDLEPIDNHRQIFSIYFIVFLNLGSLFLLNYFAGIIVDSFKEEQNKMTGYTLLDKHEQDWVNVQFRCLKSQPICKLHINQNATDFQKKCFAFINNQYTQIFISCCIILNTINFMLKWNNQDEAIIHLCKIVNYIFVAIFTCETAINLYAMRSQFFQISWNRLDFYVLIMIISGNILENFSFLTKIKEIGALIHLCKIAIILRLIKKNQDLKDLVSIFMLSLPPLVNIISLMSLLLYIYSIIGMDFFSYILWSEDGLNEEVNFTSFSKSLFSLYLASTGQGFPQVLIGIVRPRQPNYACININNYEDYKNYGLKGCGSNSGYIYLISFMISSSFIVLNLFLTFILEVYFNHLARQESLITPKMIKQFKLVWRKFDIAGEGFIPVSQLYDIFDNLDYPLGWTNSLIKSRKQKKEYLRCMSFPIYVRGDKKPGKKTFLLFYYDVLEVIVQRAFHISYSFKIIPQDKGTSYINQQLKDARQQKVQLCQHYQLLSTYTFHQILAAQMILDKIIAQRNKKAAKNQFQKNQIKPISYRITYDNIKITNKNHLEEVKAEDNEEFKISQRTLNKSDCDDLVRFDSYEQADSSNNDEILPIQQVQHQTEMAESHRTTEFEGYKVKNGVILFSNSYTGDGLIFEMLNQKQQQEQ